MSAKPSAAEAAGHDSDYDTYMLSHKKTMKRSDTAPHSAVEGGDYVSPSSDSNSQFYSALEPELHSDVEVEQKLVTLMRDRTSKKQKQAQFKKR